MTNSVTPPVCSICHKPVKLETSKTDAQGRAIHEECYVQAVTRGAQPSQDRQPRA